MSINDCAVGPSPAAIEQVAAWVRVAGGLALRHFEQSWPSFKPDQTLVTAADLEVQSFLAARIGDAFPDDGVIGEEISYQRLDGDSEAIWVIDPIDGTTAFALGLPGWGISVGLLLNGQPHLGFYYQPLLDDLTYTVRHDLVSCKGQSIEQSVRREWAAKGFLAVTAGVHQTYQLDVRYTRALGSNGTNLVYTARGTAVAAFIPQAYVWDLVAGAAILAAAGGTLCYLDGQMIDYRQLLGREKAPQPIVAGHPDIVAPLRRRIHKRPSHHL